MDLVSVLLLSSYSFAKDFFNVFSAKDTALLMELPFLSDFILIF